MEANILNPLIKNLREIRKLREKIDGPVPQSLENLSEELILCIEGLKKALTELRKSSEAREMHSQENFPNQEVRDLLLESLVTISKIADRLEIDISDILPTSSL